MSSPSRIFERARRAEADYSCVLSTDFTLKEISPFNGNIETLSVTVTLDYDA